MPGPIGTERSLQAWTKGQIWLNSEMIQPVAANQVLSSPD
jgi:hypothetical protein